MLYLMIQMYMAIPTDVVKRFQIFVNDLLTAVKPLFFS